VLLIAIFSGFIRALVNRYERFLREVAVENQWVLYPVSLFNLTSKTSRGVGSVVSQSETWSIDTRGPSLRDIGEFGSKDKGKETSRSGLNHIQSTIYNFLEFIDVPEISDIGHWPTSFTERYIVILTL